MVSFKFVLLAVFTVLQRGCMSTSGAGERYMMEYVYTMSCYHEFYYVCSFSWPVAVGHSEGQCTSGFLNFNSINESSMIVVLPDSSLSGPLSSFTRWIFPNIKFTCDASVTLA